MIISATSHVIKKIWIIFLLIIIAFIVLVSALMHGISIQHLTLPNLKIERFHMKLDKKLILSAHKIEYKRDSKSKTSVYEINKILSYFKYLNPIFKTISLKNVTYNDEKVNLLYKDDIFYLNSKFLTIDANVTQDNRKIIKIYIQQMILKDYKLELKGDLTLNLRKRLYTYHGKFDILNISGNVNINVNKDMLYYDLNTSSFNSLTPIMKYLKSKVFIEPLAREWIYKKIVAKRYKLTYLKGKFNLKTKNFYPLSVNGMATAKNVKIQFHPLVSSVYAKNITITLKNNTLFFKPVKPIYKKKNIKVNDIHIYNLLTTKNGIVVNISASTLLDKHVHNILKNFKINIPITQTSGKNSSNIILNIRFRPFGIKAKGKFLVHNSHFKILGIPFFTKEAKIKMDNYNVFLENCNLSYKKLFDLNVTGLLKSKIGTFDGNVDIISFLLNIKNNPILHISNLKKQPVNMKIKNKNNIIVLKTLKTKLLFEKEKNQFILNDLTLYKKFSKFIKKYDFKKGSIAVKTNDFKIYNARLKLYGLVTPFMYKKKKIKDFDIHISTDGKEIKAFTDDKKIYLSYNKHLILNLSNLDMVIDNNKTSALDKMNISLNGKNVNFLIKDLNSTIINDSFTLNRFKNETRFASSYMNSSFGFEQNRSYIKIHGDNLSSYFINRAINKNILDGGAVKVRAKGISTQMLDGNITIKNSILKNFSLFNNIMAAINTIPSLVLLKDPSFNELGYLVKKGFISFKINGDTISFNQIRLHGVSADMVGVGYINLQSKKIDMNMQIKTLKDISKVIKNIPLVGYILLGEDKSISTEVAIKGTTDNPTVKTQLLKDTINSPLNIIKRVLTSPLKLFQ